MWLEIPQSASPHQTGLYEAIASYYWPYNCRPHSKPGSCIAGFCDCTWSILGTSWVEYFEPVIHRMAIRLKRLNKQWSERIHWGRATEQKFTSTLPIALLVLVSEQCGSELTPLERWWVGDVTETHLIGVLPRRFISNRLILRVWAVREAGFLGS